MLFREEPAPAPADVPRQRGALPIVVLIVGGWLLATSAEARATAVWLVGEAVVLAWCLPMLGGGAYCLSWYLLLLLQRPNNSIFDWMTVCWGLGLLASLCLLLAGPLLGPLLDGWSVTVPIPTVYLLSLIHI